MFNEIPDKVVIDIGTDEVVVEIGADRFGTGYKREDEVVQMNKRSQYRSQ